jgi:chlorophyllide a hydrolase
VNAQVDTSLPSAQVADGHAQSRSAGQLTLIYWGISTLLGLIFLRDWLTSWNVPATFANPGLVALLIVSLLCGQGLYYAVARHDGRPIRWGPTWLFAIGNGICETLAFALVYRLGEVIGNSITNTFAPSLDMLGFTIGLSLFIIYGGLIHALFWLRILPPHLDNSPRARRIRKIRPVGEILLVLGWSLCLWLNQDIWTMVFFHIIVDFGLMLLVRPPIFSAEARRAAH